MAKIRWKQQKECYCVTAKTGAASMSIDIDARSVHRAVLEGVGLRAEPAFYDGKFCITVATGLPGNHPDLDEVPGAVVEQSIDQLFELDCDIFMDADDGSVRRLLDDLRAVCVRLDAWLSASASDK